MKIYHKDLAVNQRNIKNVENINQNITKVIIKKDLNTIINIINHKKRNGMINIKIKNIVRRERKIANVGYAKKLDIMLMNAQKEKTIKKRLNI